MRVLRALTVVLILTLARTAHADSPTTQPATASMTPKQTLVYWVNHGPSMSIDDILKNIAYSGDTQTAIAKLTAQQIAAEIKLQSAVHNKWGIDAEPIVLHACSTDSR